MTCEPLRAEQVEAVARILTTKRIGLFLPMGFGKTRATITALTLAGLPRTLVVAPRLAAKDTWPAELEKTAPGVSYAWIGGTPEQRVEKLCGDETVHIISRDLLNWLTTTGLKQVRRRIGRVTRYDAVVVDELSGFKHHNSQRTKALNQLVNNQNPPTYVIGLTGTPASNGYMDLFSEMKIIDGGQALGTYVIHYRDRYFEADNPYSPYPKYVLRRGADKEIEDRIAPRVMSLTDDNLRKLLPDIMYKEVPVPLPEKLLYGPRGYRTFMEHSVFGVLEKKSVNGVVVPQLADWAIPAATKAVLRMKALQYTAGFIYRDDHTAEVIHRNKLDRLKEIVEDLDGDPVLIAYAFQWEADQILRMFPKAVSVKDKNFVERWNSGDIPVALAHPASAGHGLNLQFGGANMVWTTLTDNAELWQQFNRRLYRPGQTRPVSIQVLVTPGTYDPDVYSALQGKVSLEESLRSHLTNVMSNH